MAVIDIARGRTVQKKDRIGGLRAVYFINYDEADYQGGITPTFDSTDTDVITSLGSTITLFKYDLKGASSLKQKQTASRENGTIFVDQTLTLMLKRLTKETHFDIYSLAAGRPRILVEDYNGVLQLVGLERGAEIDDTDIDTGANYGDFYGYTLIAKGMEDKPANFVEEGAIWLAGKTGSTAAG